MEPIRIEYDGRELSPEDLEVTEDGRLFLKGVGELVREDGGPAVPECKSCDAS